MDAYPNITVCDPTAALHPGILATIFQYVRTPWCKETNFCRNWIVFTHVCRRWREVALLFPILWDKIDLAKSNKGFARNMLRRAKDAPLEIYACTREYWAGWSLPEKRFLSLWEKEILPRFGRIRTIELDLVLDSPLMKLPVRSARPRELSPAPLLESISLDFGSSATMILLIPCLKRFMPSLRHLKISDGISFWVKQPRIQTNINPLDHFPICPRLVSLTLLSTPEGISFPISQLLHSILPSLPLLEIVMLFDSVTEVTEAEYHVLARLPKVPLPRLSSLYLCTSFYCNSVIFKVIQYPLTTITTLYCSGAFPPSVRVTSSMVPMFSRFYDNCIPPVTDLHIRFYDEHGHFIIYTGTYSEKRLADIILAGGHLSSSPSPSQVFQILLPSIPLRNIRNLLVDGFEDVFDNQLAVWVLFLSVMPMLTSLSIHIAKQKLLRGILEASLENRMIFPWLRRLDIFEESERAGQIQFDTQMLWVLAKVARARELAGNPIEELNLNSGIILDEEVLEELEGIIDEVRHNYVDPDL